ncbi:ATP-dependent endonuclease [Microbacterium abyssi]|uniref:ATP-dependent endonuclease n=1 Tax=Microbacterium abyssi TaxID=2782166 RepID=UPI001889268B|nr:ATP-dependent endonuclease [Microbacterium sp. A18JL241]
MSVGSAARRPVVLFEGRSDSLAFRALARRRGVRLDAVELIELGGITNLRRQLVTLPADGRLSVLGLYDGAEKRYVSGVLRDVGLIDDDAVDLRTVGFFGCERDLEDEVIRAAGAEVVLETLAARGELTRFRVFQGQPAQRERSIEQQLHRFAGTAAGRKARFAADVIDVVPLERMPRPLTDLLQAALRRS